MAEQPAATPPLPAHALLQLMWLASPALPVGGFSYSEGLESAVDAGLADTEATAQQWLLDQLALALGRADLAVVYEPLAPVHLLELLDERGIGRVPVSRSEYATLGCNVLAVAPGVVVLPEGNPGVAAALRAHGVDVHHYAASEINKGEGGPTCLTRPLRRS